MEKKNLLYYIERVKSTRGKKSRVYTKHIKVNPKSKSKSKPVRNHKECKRKNLLRLKKNLIPNAEKEFVNSLQVLRPTESRYKDDKRVLEIKLRANISLRNNECKNTKLNYQIKPRNSEKYNK